MSHPHDKADGRTPAKAHVSRGFFTVLVLCLIAVGGVAVNTFLSHPNEAPLTADDDTITTTVTTVSPTTATTAKPVAVTPATTTTSVETTAVTQAAALYVLPLSNKILTPFTEQPLYNETLDNYRAHTAVDFDGEEGQPVRPFADGTVNSVERDALWGGCVTVDHGSGVISVYRGIEPAVEVGDELTTDDHLGTLATVPCESKLGPHLHMELYKDGTAADVAVLFDKQLITE